MKWNCIVVEMYDKQLLESTRLVLDPLMSMMKSAQLIDSKYVINMLCLDDIITLSREYEWV